MIVSWSPPMPTMASIPVPELAASRAPAISPSSRRTIRGPAALRGSIRAWGAGRRGRGGIPGKGDSTQVARQGIVEVQRAPGLRARDDLLHVPDRSQARESVGLH